MTNKNLLKEAIADAKAVKETAIANAKLALEEAFTPHLKSMLSAKLQEMDDEEEVNEVEKEEVDENSETTAFDYANSTAGPTLDPIPAKVGKSQSKSYADKASVMKDIKEEEVEEEVNLDELLKELAEDARTDAEEEGYKDGMKDEKEDLDENARTDAEEEGYKDGMKDEKEDMKEDARTDAEEEGYKDGEEDEKEDMEDGMEDEEIDLEDMSEDDLKSFIEDVISDMVSAGEIEPGEEFVEDEVEVEDVEDVEVEDDVDVDIEIDEAKKEEVDEAKKEEVDEMSDPVMRHGEKGDNEVEKETEKMRFKEVMSEIEALKSELQEVNLLNAKLLYTNKIFKEKNLTENKKVKVLKAFDNAKTVKDAKSIFETLSEGILDTPTINESIKLGAASKATGLEPKRTEKQPIIESNDVYNRMRKLAGLI